MSSGQVTDDNLITRRKNITKGIEEIRAKKAEIAKALRELGVSSEGHNEQNKSFIKQLINAFDTLSEQETQYLDILKTIVNIHEQATLDIAADFEAKIAADEKRIAENKKKNEAVEAAKVENQEIQEEQSEEQSEEDAQHTIDELHAALLELKQVSEAAVAASEMNEKLVEQLQLQKKKKNAINELKTKKGKELDEEAARVRATVVERINKMSNIKKSNDKQEKELEELRKQCLTLGLAVGGGDQNPELAEEAAQAVADDSQRVPKIEHFGKKQELNEEEKERRREEIRENIKREVEQKEQVNVLIREKLAAMEARKLRLQQIRQMLENQEAAEQAVKAEAAEVVAPAENGADDVEKAPIATDEVKEAEAEEQQVVEQSLEDILENAKVNLSNLTAMRERLEHIQETGGQDLDEEDVALLENLDHMDVISGNSIESIVRETFSSALGGKKIGGERSKEQEDVQKARLISIETLVKENNELLRSFEKKLAVLSPAPFSTSVAIDTDAEVKKAAAQAHCEQKQQQQKPAISVISRLEQLTTDELRQLGSCVHLMADVKDGKVSAQREDILDNIRDIILEILTKG